jgi:murein DD-endopeptidase MepM/ murein hydrolase activator NlpD
MNQDAWINDLRQNLPESGVATVIVTKSQGASYLELSREQVDQYRSLLQARKRKRQLLSGSAAAICTVIFTVLALSVSTLKSGIETREQYITALTDPLAELAQNLPEFAQLDESLHSPDMVTRIEALKRLITLQDQSFRFYVESTRQVIARDQETLLESLRGTGIDYDTAGLHHYDNAVGGTVASDGILDLTAFYLQDPLLNLLNERAYLDDFLRHLPLAHPLSNARVTSRFGVRRHPISGNRELHHGVDFVSYSHPQVMTAADGIVTFAGQNDGYGKKLIISHANEITTLYAHLASFAVQVGDAVSQGDVIGIMGNTGRSTASHLHYEVHLNGQRIDPLKLFGIYNHVR